MRPMWILRVSRKHDAFPSRVQLLVLIEISSDIPVERWSQFERIAGVSIHSLYPSCFSELSILIWLTRLGIENTMRLYRRQLTEYPDPWLKVFWTRKPTEGVIISIHVGSELSYLAASTKPSDTKLQEDDEWGRKMSNSVACSLLTLLPSAPPLLSEGYLFQLNLIIEFFQIIWEKWQSFSRVCNAGAEPALSNWVATSSKKWLVMFSMLP